MTVVLDKPRYTPEDLLTMPGGERYELADGELVEKSEMGLEASWVAGQVFGRLWRWNEDLRAGHALPAEASYQCFAEEPGRVRRPDASFILAGRLPGERIPKGHSRVVPDLVVEVVSPNDLCSEVLVKTEEYLRAGVQLLWVVDPETRAVLVRRADGSVAILHAGDELEGGVVLPGFRCAVGDLFPTPAAGEPDPPASGSDD